MPISVRRASWIIRPASAVAGLEAPRSMITIHDPSRCGLIREHLGVEVYAFKFSRTNLTGILSSIRLELAERLTKLHPPPRKAKAGVTVVAAADVDREDILDFRPNLFGLGVNGNAVWRRLLLGRASLLLFT